MAVLAGVFRKHSTSRILVGAGPVSRHFSADARFPHRGNRALRRLSEWKNSVPWRSSSSTPPKSVSSPPAPTKILDISLMEVCRIASKSDKLWNRGITSQPGLGAACVFDVKPPRKRQFANCLSAAQREFLQIAEAPQAYGEDTAPDGQEVIPRFRNRTRSISADTGRSNCPARPGVVYSCTYERS